MKIYFKQLFSNKLGKKKKIFQKFLRKHLAVTERLCNFASEKIGKIFGKIFKI